MIKFLRNGETAFQIFLPFHAHNLCMRDAGLPYLCQYLVQFVFQILAITIGV